MSRTFFLAFLLLLFVSVAPVSFAQDKKNLDLTVSPALFELTATPGGTITQRFRIRNNSDKQLELTLSVDKLSSGDESGNVTPLKAPTSDTSPSWFSFESANVKATPREWTDAQFKISVPKESAFGYYFSLRISQKSATSVGGTAQVVGEIIIPILLDVKKDGAKREAKLISFEPTSFLNEYLPVSFQTRVSNTGNVHIKPQGNIFIRGAGDKDLGILEINADQGNILPGGTRLFHSSWDDGFITFEPDNSSDAKNPSQSEKKHFVINWNKLTHFRIGKYTANVLLVYDNGSRDVTIESSTTFWVFPITAFVELIMTITVVFFGVKMLLSWYVKSQIARYEKHSSQRS